MFDCCYNLSPISPPGPRVPPDESPCNYLSLSLRAFLLSLRVSCVAIRGRNPHGAQNGDSARENAATQQALWSSVMLQTGDIPAAMVSAQKRKPPPPFPPL